MAFARFSDDCDVYIYKTIQESTGKLIFTCSCCLLQDGDDPLNLETDFWCYGVDDLLYHIRKHRNCGHKVPTFVDEILIEEK